MVDQSYWLARCNQVDGEVTQISCLLNFDGRKAYIDRLQNILPKL